MARTTPEQLLRRVFPPMLATLTDTAPDPAGWSFELKYDGFRAVTAIVDGQLAMWSRNELDLAPRFPEVVAALAKLKVGEVVLDGEVVVLDDQGAPRFQLLQQGEHREIVFLFDVLWLDGEDLRKRPYLERRTILEKLLRRPPARVKPSVRIDEDGVSALKEASDAGYEGIIAKRNSSIYEGRRSNEWLKIKAINEQELVVVGWQPSTHSDREIGSLHLAVTGDDGELHYAGKVGTGFSSKQRVWFHDELSKDVVAKSLVRDAPRVRDATWVKPRFVVQVAFTEWTSDQKLRHPAFLGMRDDKSPEEVVREKPVAVASSKSTAPSRKSTSTKSSVNPAAPSKTSTKSAKASSKPTAKSAKKPAVEVALTHPERVLYPKDGITKQDVADYYQAVSAPMIAALRDRPLALEHWNAGIDQPSWFHQDVGRNAPDWLTTITTPTRVSRKANIDHLVVDRPETLRWLAQMSVLTIHMWSSHAPTLEEPDWLIFDLDPAKGKGIEQAIEAAIIMRRLLEHMNLPSVPKTSGKRGIHVLIPLARGHSHEAATEFACNIAGAVASQIPTMTVERAIAQRHGRLYLDCMQNGYGKTIVAPYSLRAIDGAPVSAPLQWDEITPKLDPKKFNLHTMPERLAKVGDLFAAVFSEGVVLPKLA